MGMLNKTGLARLMTVVATGVAVVVLAACGSSSDGGQSGSTDGDAGGADTEQTVGAVLYNDSPASVEMWKSFEERSKSLGWRTLPFLSHDGDPAKLLDSVRNLITGGATGIMIDPVDPRANVPALEYAQERGVEIVAMDQTVQDGELYMITTTDNVVMAKQACEATGEALGGTGVVIALNGPVTATSGRDRRAGFADCMDEQFPDINVVHHDTQFDASRAASQLQTSLTEYPDADAVFMMSDTLFLPTVLQTLRSKNKTAKVGEPGHVFIASIDGTPPALEAIRNGQVDVIVSQPITQYGKLSADYLQDAFAGREQEVGPTDHDSEIIEYFGNLSDILPSTLVTEDNVDDPELWGNQK